MTNILVMPPNKNIDYLINTDIGGFILGLKNFTIFNNCQFDIKELEIVVSKLKQANKKVFIDINKIIYNEDIPLLKEYLLIIETWQIDGIIFDDIAIVNLKKELNLKTELVWHQNHLVTNFHTCNYWYKQEVNFGFLANEITLQEILQIKQNTKMKLMLQVYGYLPIMQSSRSLLTNYFSYVNKTKKDDFYKIYESDRVSSNIIYEDNNGTYMLSSSVLNAMRELPSLIEQQMDYIILSGLYIEEESFINIINLFNKALQNINDLSVVNDLATELEQDNRLSYDRGFLYKETIYKVKSNE